MSGPRAFAALVLVMSSLGFAGCNPAAYSSRAPAGTRVGTPPCEPWRAGCYPTAAGSATYSRNYWACIRNADSKEEEARCHHPTDPLLRDPSVFDSEWESYTRCLRNADRRHERQRCVEPPPPVALDDAMSGCDAPFHRCDPARGGSVPPLLPGP